MATAEAGTTAIGMGSSACGMMSLNDSWIISSST